MTDITAKLAEALRDTLKWLQDERLGTYMYMEGPDFYRDKDLAVADIEDALTAYTASQSTRDEETVERMADRFDHALNVALVAEALLKGFWFSDEKQAVRAARAALSAIPARDEALEGLRPEVLAFARLMETKLRANDHKPGWKSDRAADLWRRLSADETYELYEAITADAPDPKHIGSEAADIANFAMMIADVCGALSDETVRAKLAAQAGER